MTEVVATVEAEASPDVLAVVQGEKLSELPTDLYIPPHALEVILEAFEGPLDLLLYLIRKQNLDILNIPIASITAQYMDYVDLMKDLHLDLAGEYLVMAALLAEIKSRMLLPRAITEEGEEADPRAELVRRLQEYERFKKAAEDIDNLPRTGRDIFPVEAALPELKQERPLPQVELKDMLAALQDVLRRVELTAHHHVGREPLSVRERMSNILAIVSERKFVEFTELFTPEEGRMGVVVSFIAILELIKVASIDIVQAKPFAPIHIKAIA